MSLKMSLYLNDFETLGAQTNIRFKRELSFDMPATLRGYILDKTTKAKLAWVMIEVNGISTTSNEEGYYELKDIPVGTYTLKVRTMLYRPYTRGIEIPEERVYELDIELERAYLQATAGEPEMCPIVTRCPFVGTIKTMQLDIAKMKVDIAKMKTDLRWIKWILGFILAAIVGSAIFL